MYFTQGIVFSQRYQLLQPEHSISIICMSKNSYGYEGKFTKLSQRICLEFSVCNEPKMLIPLLKGGDFEENKGLFKNLIHEPSTDDATEGDTRRSPGKGRPHMDMSELPTYNTCGQAYNLS